MKTKILYISLAVLLIIPNFINKDINGQPAYNGLERYDPALSGINSIDKLERYVDACAALKHLDTSDEKYTSLLAYIISCRFYHGFSHFTLKENWIAATGEKLIGYGLASKVEPDKIMLHPYAACSQQSLVMMEILRRKHISYRKVGFPHHYALEVNLNRHWYFFDPNMEPDINLSQRLHESWKGNNDSLKKYYSAAKHSNLDYQFGHTAKAEFGLINEVPAKRAKAFQGFTAFLSKILWCFPLFFVFAKKRRRTMYAVKPINHFPRQRNLNPVFSA